MISSGLTLRDLEYLVAVAEHQHFGRAAKACHVSQPALSAQVKKVEDQLGVAFFERTKRHVSMTPAGERLLEQVRHVLDEAKRLVELASEQSAPLTGKLRLGAIATVGPYLWPHLLKPLRQSFPKLQLLLHEGLTDELLKELKSGALDAVIASPTFDEPTLTTRPLYFEPFVLATPKHHPLSEKTPLLTLDLQAKEMVLLEDGHCLKDQTLDFCPANRRGHTHDFHATSLETLRHLVASGIGYTLIPALATEGDRRLESLLEYRGFANPDVGRAIVLVYRQRSAAARELDMLAEFIRKHRPKSMLELKSLQPSA